MNGARFAVLLLMGLLSLAAFAQSVAAGDWDKLNQEATQLYRAGNYLGAVDVVKKALELAEKAFGPDHPTVATSLNNLAKLLRETNRAKEAEDLEQRVARIRAIKR